MGTQSVHVPDTVCIVQQRPRTVICELNVVPSAPSKSRPSPCVIDYHFPSTALNALLLLWLANSHTGCNRKSCKHKGPCHDSSQPFFSTPFPDPDPDCPATDCLGERVAVECIRQQYTNTDQLPHSQVVHNLQYTCLCEGNVSPSYGLMVSRARKKKTQSRAGSAYRQLAV